MWQQLVAASLALCGAAILAYAHFSLKRLRRDARLDAIEKLFEKPKIGV